MQKSAFGYVFFDGKCREAFEFYEKLGIGKIESMISNEEAPPGAEYDPTRKNNIMHGALKIGDTLLMASDVPPKWYAKPQGFDIHLTATGVEDAERLFAALSEGGEVKMPLEKSFWAERFGGCVDRFGIPWMVSVDPQG